MGLLSNFTNTGVSRKRSRVQENAGGAVECGHDGPKIAKIRHLESVENAAGRIPARVVEVDASSLILKAQFQATEDAESSPGKPSDFIVVLVERVLDPKAEVDVLVDRIVSVDAAEKVVITHDGLE